MIKEQKKSLLRRRKIYTIIAALLVIVLIPTLITITYLSKNKTFEDIDGTTYKIKYDDGIYQMYSPNGDPLEYDEELRLQVSAGEMYRFYITDAGSVIKLNIESGEAEIFAVVDDLNTVESEQLGYNANLLIYPRVEKARIRSIEVVNDKGAYTFYRYNLDLEKIDDSCDFIIKGSPYAPFDEEAFSSLYLGAGYTLTSQKVVDPIKDEESGEYLEYGLGKQIRINEEGEEYEYTPAYVTLTDTKGNKHRLIVGDRLVTGGGYYVQYVSFDGDTEVKRDAVYVLDDDVGLTAKGTVEMFVKPTLNYPMSINNYLQLKNFKLYNEKTDTTDVAFSYLSTEERGIYSAITYEFELDKYDGYIPNSDRIQSVLTYFYQMDFVGVTKLAPSDEELIKYGLGKLVPDGDKEKFEYDGAYQILFDYEVYDDSNKYVETLKHMIYVSEKNEAGNYYAYSLIFDSKTLEPIYSYDMIVEIKGHCFNFLEWHSSDWIENRYFALNIAHCQTIKLETRDYWANFTLDNSLSDTSAQINSTYIQIHGEDSRGNDLNTFSSLRVQDMNGNIWTITQRDITAVNSQGTKLTITDSYFAYNALGIQVKAVPSYISCANGSRVDVTPDEVVITDQNGNKTTYVRYATDLFRLLYQTLSTSTFENYYILTEEEESALIADESKLLLALTVTDINGETTEYKFYSLTSQKAYITVNGNGGFYVLPTRVEKFISDTHKFFDFEIIDPSAKN